MSCGVFAKILVVYPYLPFEYERRDGEDGYLATERNQKLRFWFIRMIRGEGFGTMLQEESWSKQYSLRLSLPMIIDDPLCVGGVHELPREL